MIGHSYCSTSVPMRQKSGTRKEPAAKVVKDIRRAMRKQNSAEETIRIVLRGLRGEDHLRVQPEKS